VAYASADVQIHAAANFASFSLFVSASLTRDCMQSPLAKKDARCPAVCKRRRSRLSISMPAHYFLSGYHKSKGNLWERINARAIQFASSIPLRVKALSGWAANCRHAAAMLRYPCHLRSSMAVLRNAAMT
jgi:hypothetical protein